jgi:hypothetical protein
MLFINEGKLLAGATGRYGVLSPSANGRHLFIVIVIEPRENDYDYEKTQKAWGKHLIALERRAALCCWHESKQHFANETLCP